MLKSIAVKKKWFVLFASVIFGLHGITAQDTTGTWFNTNGEASNGATAPFYRLTWKEDGIWKTQEHFRSGPLYQTGQYLDSAYSAKTGTFNTFNKDSVKVVEENFKGKNRVGPYMKWYDDGTVDTKGQYAEAPVTEKTETVDYWSSEQVFSHPMSEDQGVKIGVWEYYHPNGQLSAREEYTDSGSLSRSVYMNPDGSQSDDSDDTERMPRYPDGEAALMKFLGENIVYPVSDRNAGRSGEVQISFVVGRDGQPAEPRVERTESPAMSAECLRLIGIMPSWIPGRAHNRYEEVRYFLPVRFSNYSNRGIREMKKKLEKSK